MSRLHSRYYFDIPGLLVNAELLGGSLVFQYRGVRVEIRLPKAPEDFRAGHPLPTQLPAIYGQSGRRRDGRQYQSVRVVQVTVTAEAGLDLASYDPTDAAQLDTVSQTFDSSFLVAADAVRTFSDFVRTRLGQSWLPATGEPLERTGLQGAFDDAGTDVRIRQKLALGGRSGWIVETGLEAETMQEIGELLASSAPLRLARVFLADARHAVMDLVPPDSARAVIFTTIGLEVIIAETLLRLARPEQRQLVELVVGRLVEAALGTRKSLDDGLDAVVGRSLKRENRRLFDRVNDLLVARNDLVHDGKVPSYEVARVGLITAESVASWLDAIPTPVPGTRQPT